MTLVSYQRRKQLRKIPFLVPVYRRLRNWWHSASFVCCSGVPLSFAERLKLVRNFRRVSNEVECAHTDGEILEVMAGILSLPSSVEGAVLEAGCFKGGSTAKFSTVCHRLRRKLLAYDSFEGIPENDDPHDQPSVFGHTSHFPAGIYAGSFEEVTGAVSKFGHPEVCTFVKGWFDDTMPSLAEPLAAAYIDVDLPSSTRTCLKYLYPLLSPGGLLFSQDAHLPPVVDVIEDSAFWRDELGVVKPPITYSRHKTVLWIRKPNN